MDQNATLRSVSMHLKAPAWRSSLTIWLVATAIAVVSCSLNMSAAHIGGDWFPVGHDAFYHGRRILDAVAGHFYQFDPKIHAPEGSMLVWPWGYDYFMAGLVRAGLALGLSTEPIKILLWLPVAAVALSIGLLILIGRRLALSNWPIALAALCMALAPTTQLLHGYGEIDHHFAELICVLAALAAGLAWFRMPSTRNSIVLGAVFGLSLCIHNGLFILQVPFLVTLLVRWLQGQSPPRQPIVALAASLLLSALAILLPSLPFREGRFEFYTLSWFHLYIATGTASTALLLTWLKPGRVSVAALVALAAVLLFPLISEMQIGQSFLTGSLGMLSSIEEMRSPLKMAFQDGLVALVNFYSYLVWIAPLTLALCLIQCWRERQRPRLLFWITSSIGLVLLSMQIRLHYFGAFALYFPWLIVLHDYVSARPDLAKRAYLLATLALLLAYVPQIRHTLIAPIPRAGDIWFERLHPIFPKMRKACAEDPGIVLSDSTAGHYIRYYTDCSVIANNFLLTKQQFDKVAEAWRLMELPASELPKQAPQVKYVLVRPATVVRKPDGEYTFSFFNDGSPELPTELLLRPQAEIPPTYRLIDEVRFELRYDDHSETFPYARLYKIVPSPSASPTP
ncbi:hypothetical protein [Steroidobacter sp.]|uniref:hypothetical protein n=1 Tax=Steroidobacter sp. TaxID=1978227 RepID=UPI001A5BEA42|nr:hypothetical protein [Steroidobacter sp.]MBL8268655.1 hypothetical protein [Steroidobacter sp.]